jgi:hypothetical protein
MEYIVQPQSDDTRAPNLFSVKNYGFIGYDRDKVVAPFSGTDTEELYNKNLNENSNHPDFSKYLGKPISYVRNSLGHRSCELDFIKSTKKPYILVVGDSFTEGTGLHYEETYGSKLSVKTGLPVYNLGLAGTGIDTMLHNLVAWRNHMAQSPKILVVQWTQNFRTASMDFGTKLITGTRGPHSFVDPTIPENRDIFNFIDGGLNSGAFDTRAVMAESLIKELYKQSEIVNVHVPGWETDLYGTARSVSWRPDPTSIPDFARDLQHRGAQGHEELAANILKLFNKFR